ncbi:MAG: TRAM domain-containing protein [Acidobacteria bacterium]|nr:TRAM domain-containing protein [Acidobacteriota bacterium]
MSGFDEEVLDTLRPALGGAVGHLGDGTAVFVRHALEGERVRVRINERTAKFARGDALEILSAHPGRVKAPCPHAGLDRCGGCDLQHADEATQVAWKARVASDQLRRLGGVEHEVEVISVGEARGSRSRLRCLVDNEGRLALRRVRRHDPEVLTTCWLLDERAQIAFSTRWPRGAEVEIRALGEGEPFAVVRLPGRPTEIRDLEGRVLHPDTVSRVDLDSHVFTVSPDSFWQSHHLAPEVLSDRVVEAWREAPGARVVDLYSGVGLFAHALERAGASEVVTLESSPSAVRDARENLRGRRGVKVLARRVEPRTLAPVLREGDVVVCDPPRTGLARGVAQALGQAGVARVVYVSCDGATLARDIRALSQVGYVPRSLESFDLFPLTEHLEFVAVLDRG